MSELEDAWSDLHAALPGGWTLGRPSEHPERREWLLYAYDPRERPKSGRQKPGVDRGRRD